jgi:hypothetical protein
MRAMQVRIHVSSVCAATSDCANKMERLGSIPEARRMAEVDRTWRLRSGVSHGNVIAWRSTTQKRQS